MTPWLEQRVHNQGLASIVDTISPSVLIYGSPILKPQFTFNKPLQSLCDYEAVG